MRLHTLRPAEGSKKDTSVKAAVPQPDRVKLPAEVRTAKNHVQAAAYVRALKVVRCHWLADCQNVVSQTIVSKKNTPS